MSTVKILIVEDEVVIADHMADTLEELGYEVAEPCISYTAALNAIEEGMPDLAILDIQLSGRKSGIDLAEVINERYQFPVIFLTSNTDQETLSLAKKVAPAAFLVKPYTREDLFTAIEVALYNFAEQKKKAINRENLIIKDAIFIKKKGVFNRVNLSDILYIKSSHIYLDIVLVSGDLFTIRSSFAQFGGKLTERFVKIHRSYVVNLDHMESITATAMVVGGEEIPISKAHRESILKGVQIG